MGFAHFDMVLKLMEGCRLENGKSHLTDGLDGDKYSDRGGTEAEIVEGCRIENT